MVFISDRPVRMLGRLTAIPATRQQTRSPEKLEKAIPNQWRIKMGLIFNIEPLPNLCCTFHPAHCGLHLGPGITKWNEMSDGSSSFINRNIFLCKLSFNGLLLLLIINSNSLWQQHWLDAVSSRTEPSGGRVMIESHYLINWWREIYRLLLFLVDRIISVLNVYSLCDHICRFISYWTARRLLSSGYNLPSRRATQPPV